MGIFIGTLGIFFTFYLIFVRVAPVVAIAEIKAILKLAGDQHIGSNAKHHAHGHAEAEHEKI
jgi:molybdopterin-containing oxidoreductase family membrane subunit